MNFPTDSARLADAFRYATELHADQKRKGTERPYLSHLLAVAGLVVENGGDEDQTIAALLHDGPEDRGGLETLATIRERFGDRVADLVSDCSDTFEEPKSEWRLRKKQYIEHAGKQASLDALLVSLADKVHNLGCIERDFRHLGDRIWERFAADRVQVLWYYESLHGVYKERLGESQKVLITELRRLLRVLHRAGVG